MKKNNNPPRPYGIEAYAVWLPRDNSETGFYATKEAFPALFWRRKQAVGFKNELAAHEMKGTVVKVTVEITPQEKL